MNQVILDKLTQLASFIKQSDKFRHKALLTAIENIKAYSKQITSGKQARDEIPHIGDGIAKRIDEILKTGTLSELAVITQEEKKEKSAMDELLQITGVGEKRAQEWIDQGITTIAQLKDAIKNKTTTSTHHIDIGLKYMDDFNKRIPRHEIELAEKMMRKVLAEINPKLMMYVCGSFRRGLPTSGDMDVLVSNPDMKDKKQYLPVIVQALAKDGFIIDSLTENGTKKYMGVCKVEEFARRLDIRVVDYDAFYACLIYFTGSKNFNIQIRNKALELGYSLNEYGLKDKKTNKLRSLKDEKELFELLKMDYVEPTKRDI